MGNTGHLETGEWGERVSARMLKKKKYKILHRRARVSARDEIDLVVLDGKTLVFVEVKTRKSEDFGRPISAVDRRKRDVLSRAAVRYIKSLRKRPDCFRFDIVEVVGTVGDKDPVIRHTENAFTLSKKYSLDY